MHDADRGDHSFVLDRMMRAGFWLALAISAEVVATSSLKATAGFTRPLPSAVVVVSYASAFYLLSLALRTMPIGIAYAIWSGIGTVLVAAIAWVAHGQKLDATALAGIALVIMGVIILNMRADVSR